MKDLLGLLAAGVIVILIVFNAFGGDDASKGMSGAYEEATYGELPDEPSKSEITQSISQSSATNIESLIEENFPLLDKVRGENGLANVYMTREFEIPELTELISEKLEPDEISERVEGKQALIYPDQFIILKESTEEPDVVLIEVASDDFVRNNYAPGFFTGMLAYRILDDVLDVDDWHKKRRNQCKNGNCYGGYTMYGGSFRSGDSGGLRGYDSRGGGPGTGK
ncbi:DUF4247 domain-containing protein [Thalassobacillus hwangdonensis]|uniref:DUF4247 domain-containing protein n=1 Tax=Thalassobacillus hwangdonensis TaxID=546108 RepID=A0ABW3L366_9BACI